MHNNKQINLENDRVNETIEIKQAFLSSAISDISTYIQLADTKVSIIMGALVAFITGVLTCCDPLCKVLSKIQPCSWLGILILIFVILHLVSLIGVFVAGILTIRGHVSKIEYKSKWFLQKSTREYSFSEFKKDVKKMTDEDIVENMSAELYKLNDINRQKSLTTKWTIRLFSSTLISGAIIGILLIISVL